MFNRFARTLNLFALAIVVCPASAQSPAEWYAQYGPVPPVVSGAKTQQTPTSAKKNANKLAAGAGAPVDASVVTVTVRATSTVADQTFALGEIADIQGADKTLVGQLSTVPIGTSPLPGLSRILLSGDILVHLRASHMDSKRIQILVPDTFRVARVGHDVSGEDILKIALAAGQDAVKDIPGATVQEMQVPGKVTLPAGKVDLLAGAYHGEPDNGTVTVPVSILVDGKSLRTVEVALRVRRKTIVVVAARQIEAHTVVTAEDVALSSADLPAGFTTPLTDLRDAIGKRATRRILTDAPLPASALETPPTIAVNDKLIIEYIVGAIRITAPGLARQSGAIGDTIHVFATDGKRELDAVVVDSHTVRIVDTETLNGG